MVRQAHHEDADAERHRRSHEQLVASYFALLGSASPIALGTAMLANASAARLRADTLAKAVA